MMFHILSTIYSLPFALGAIVGVLGHRTYCLARARHEDKRNPLPDGQRHEVGGMSRVWVGGLISVLILGYVLMQAEETHLETVALSENTRRCQVEFNQALKARSDISNKNDELSTNQRQLLADIDEATATWINRLLNLPADIATLGPDDPRRQQYGLDVTRVYYERTGKLRAQVADISEEQRRLAHDRADHPLPEPTCGH